jgi:A118 family predicted phage portal protein
MGILSTIKGWVTMLLQRNAKEDFGIELIGSDTMDAWVRECVNIYKGNPCWLDEEDHIDTVNFAKAICSETARLATLGIGIKLDGSAKAEYLQKQVEKIYFQLRNWVEYGCAYGTIILKPDGDTVRMYTPEEFEVTHETDGNIDGAVFMDQKKVGEKWYSRLEYHRFVEKLYVITNKCYVGSSQNSTNEAVNIAVTPWAHLSEEVSIENMDAPLFGVFKMPQANNVDLGSPYGLPIFSEAVQELRDLDIAYSRNAKEILDSKRTVLLDADRLLPNAERIRKPNALGSSPMPDYIKLVDGDTNIESDIYHEINPGLNTEARIIGINALLNQIGYKSGYSNGHFVFNESGGIQTATQVEADQQRTIQLIKDVRDKLESCLRGLLYAISVFADLYDLIPVGEWEVAFDFGDITYNREEDRARWWGYVVSGKVPAWKFFVKFEGMTEEEAKEMIQEAQQVPTLFGTEE